jgi:poly(hydroxyalkanoate) granule-associated protein
MNKENREFEWRRVPGMVADGTRELLKAGLGVVDVLEHQGERLFDALSGDRAALVDDLQTRGSRAIDEMQVEANRVFRDLVERGERLQEEGGKRIGEAVKGLSDRPKEMAEAVEHTVERAVGATLRRLDVPTRHEVERLTHRVERLTEQVERLASRLAGGEGAAETILEVVAVGETWCLRDLATGEILFEAGTKAEAVKTGRDRAHGAAPSELRILKQDGTVQDTSRYA